MINNIELESWLPMEPAKGPPLPRFLGIYWPWYRTPLPEPPEMGVAVGLLNPPSGATKWQMTIVDDPLMRAVDWGADMHGNIDKAAVFEFPDWLFPAPVSIAIYQEWQENGEWHSRELYQVQSLHPYLWDFAKGDWGYEEDPTYREVFIPEYGSYYYNVATEQFERV